MVWNGLAMIVYIYINIYLSYHAKNNAQNAIASESIAHGHI